jgi:sugar phosphate isomerase/epimerase
MAIPISRRQFSTAVASSAATMCVGAARAAVAPERWKMQYVLGSCLYGTASLREILPELAKTGAAHLDVWPRIHGNQREQMDELGHDNVRALLQEHAAKVAIFTRYDLGPFRLQGEIQVAQQFGAPMVICGGQGPKGLAGEDLKQAVREFVKRLEPTLAVAERAGVTIGIENHGQNLIESPDSLRYLADFAKGRPLGIAIAPYHLPQDPRSLTQLIEDLGPRLVHFYAWQHGSGAVANLPKDEELTQLPGRGKLDFAPLIAALAKINYSGFTEVFMHPTPRGIPICAPTAEVTSEVVRARAYLESLIPA